MSQSSEWNRPVKGGNNKVKDTRNFKGAVAGAVVVALSVAAFLALHKGDEVEAPSKGVELPKGSIPEVVPAIAPARQEPKKVEETPKKVEEIEKKVPYIGRQVTNSYGKVYTVKRISKAGTRYVNGVAVETKPLFTHDSLNELDALYRTTPGFRIYSPFNAEEFDKNITEAMLSNELKVTEDDTEEVAERKRLVQEGIETLKAAINEGDSPGKLVQEARKELSKLADLRDDCIAAVTELKQSGASSEEIEEYYEAVNKKLESRDIPALLSPMTAQSRLRAIKELKEAKRR